MQYIKIVAFLFFISCIQCTTNNDEKFSIVFNSLEKEFDQNFLKEFKETPEEIVLDMHFSYFLYKYSTLIEKRHDIEAFFQTLNLNDEPSQAYLLIFLWHRKLNNKRLNLSALMKVVNDGVTGVKSCRNLKKINSVLNYKKLNINEGIQLIFPVDIEYNIKSTVYYLCPILEWDFDDSKDLIVNGKLVNKYFKDSPKEFYIQVKINDMNREGVLYFFKHIQRNDTIEVNLTSYGIKIG
jgi:hypothetical protein